MKKIVFATQVFGLIAMLPFLVILEMNHTRGGASESDSTSRVKQGTEIISISLPEKRNDKMGKEVFPNTPETFLLLKSF